MKLAFADQETTGLHRKRRAWETAVILRDLDAGTTTYGHFFTRVHDLNLARADPMALQIGGFYQRHPEMTQGPRPSGDLHTEYAATRHTEEMLRGAVIIGCNPGFDITTLLRAYRRSGIAPSHHYRPICVESIALGWLAGTGRAFSGDIIHDGAGRPVVPTSRVDVPWRSDALSRLCDVEPPIGVERHTAMGDADWAMRWFDVVTGYAYSLTGVPS